LFLTKNGKTVLYLGSLADFADRFSDIGNYLVDDVEVLNQKNRGSDGPLELLSMSDRRSMEALY
jgi:hypothetical protein